MAFQFVSNASIANKSLAVKISTQQTQAAVLGRRIEPTNAIIVTGPVFEVSVGEEGSEEIITVHQKLFTSTSEYFAKAVTGNFLESETRIVKLDRVAPKVFRLYVILLYTSELATKGTDEWLALCRLYVLAEYLLDRWAKERIIDGMHGYLTEILPTEPKHESPEKVFSAEVVQEVYDGTPEGSPLRRLIVDLYAIHGRDVWLKNLKEQLPTDFLYDVTLKMLQARPQPHASWQIPSRPSSDYWQPKLNEEKTADRPLTAAEITKST